MAVDGSNSGVALATTLHGHSNADTLKLSYIDSLYLRLRLRSGYGPRIYLPRRVLERLQNRAAIGRGGAGIGGFGDRQLTLMAAVIE